MKNTGVIKAYSRNKTGKNVARSLRQKGAIPAVVYGHNFAPVTLYINDSELAAILKPSGHGTGEHVLHKLSVEDRTDIPVKDIMIKEIQRNPVNNRILHVDFYTVQMDEKIIVPVRINVVGKSPGVQRGGILQQILREVEVKCFPSDIPHSFDVDVSSLDIGQSLHIKDMNLPANVELHIDLNAAVVSVIAPTVEKEEVAAEAPEAAPEEAPPETEKKPSEKKEPTD